MKNQPNHTRRALRVRASIRRAGGRPRLSVYRSDAHIWAQIIDDAQHKTLASASDLGLKGTKTDKSKEVGVKIAQAARAAGITTVVFDRGSYRYHGRVRVLAEAARAAGLTF